MDRIILSKNSLPKRGICLLRGMRYRFFLWAGILPYLLGQWLALYLEKSINWNYFWLGLLGIFFVVLGVELFNEYFEVSEGGDRVFSLDPKDKKSFKYAYPIGISAFLIAFIIGLYFSFKISWVIFLFCLLGFIGAYFYVGPPFKWAYHGLGEAMIALCYGPFMLIASYYLQTQKINHIIFWISLICGLSLFSLALTNEFPDYYQDRLLGKKNLVVRLGKKNALRLLFFIISILFFFSGIAVFFKEIPLSILSIFLFLPRTLKLLKNIKEDIDNPEKYRYLINNNIAIYLIFVFSLGIGLTWNFIRR